MSVADGYIENGSRNAIFVMNSFNALWSNDAIWRHISGSSLAQVIVFCLTAPSHYLSQCSLFIKEVLWHSSRINFTLSAQATSLHNEFENYALRLLPHIPVTNNPVFEVP